MLKRHSKPLFLLLIALSSVTCSGLRAEEAQAAPLAANPPPAGSYFSESQKRAPLWPRQLPTTDGRLYLRNLNATIDTLQALLASRPDASRPDTHFRLQLAGEVYYRFRILGRLADLEKARDLALQVTRQDPALARGWLLRAKLESAMHEFSSAQENLEKAKQAGAQEIEAAPIHSEIQQALHGGFMPVAADPPEPPETWGDFVQWANRAADRGDLAKADEYLSRAEYVYPDSSPYELAWVQVQHGIAFLRFGDLPRARAFFLAAHERLADFYLATEHLAETELKMGNAAEAEKLYQAVYTQTGNPEFLGGLAAAQEQLEEPQAEATLRQAFAEYDQLIARHPATYCLHGAQFYLSRGQAEKALELAQRNLQIRQDLQSLILQANAAASLGKIELACETLRRSERTELRPPELVNLQSRLRRRCRPG